MRFCSLNPQYSLRGWIGMPFALRNKDSIKRLDRNEFNALILCDGQRDLDTIELSESIQNALRLFEKEGVVTFHEKSHLIQPEQYYRHYDTKYFKSVVWSITGRCNFRCRHCYLDAPGADARGMLEQHLAAPVHHRQPGRLTRWPNAVYIP